QKVARLRALRAAEKLKPLGLWDRTVIRGRRWADIAHRTTALGLMGLTGNPFPPFTTPPSVSPPPLSNPTPVIAGIITTFSLTDMIIYNRNQRALFYATQESIYTSTLRSAIAAEQEGRPLTADETSVLNREKMVLRAEAEKERLKELGWGKRVKAFLLGEDVVKGVQEMDRSGEIVADVGSEDGAQEPVKKVEDVVGPERVMQALEEKWRGGEKLAEEVHVEGGQLDRMAEEVVEKGKSEVEKAKGGWMSWLGGSR
ncbi:MAG: hypothetical protein Q9225_006128, partial [Loekoesia sp. 1 TL-2023]